MLVTAARCTMFLAPGVRFDSDQAVVGMMAEVARAICVEPATWPERGTRMLREHLPLMVGGYPSPIRVVGVSAGMGQGNPGLAPWVAALTLAAVIAGVRARRTPGPPPTAEGVPAADRLAYLVSFRSQERVTVAPDESPRIDEYAARAAAVHAPFIGAGEGAKGEELVPGFWLCPPPDGK